jgi:hypothetical protein
VLVLRQASIIERGRFSVSALTWGGMVAIHWVAEMSLDPKLVAAAFITTPRVS